MGNSAMSSAAAPNPATQQKVTCETSDKQHITVELEVLRLSHTFDDMYKNLGLEEDSGEFPGTFPVKNVEARVFKKVVEWCRAHKGQPDPVVEKDPFMQESKWLEFTKYERHFSDVPVPELLELVSAADYLDIRGLYHYGCQAIAALIKGKATLEARHILQQQCDLTWIEISFTLAQCPWLDPQTEIVAKPGDVSVDIFSQSVHIPTEVLTTIFEKLKRADLERLQLASKQFRNTIVDNNALPLRLVYEVIFTTSANHWNYNERRCFVILSVDNAMRLKGCVVRKLRFLNPISSAHFALLLRVKPTWKDTYASVSLEHFSSPASLTRAFTDLLFCRKLRVYGYLACSPHSFMHLPAILSCNHLDLSGIFFEIRGVAHESLEPADVVEWLEHEPDREWDELRQMDVRERELGGGLVGVLDALKKAFLSATNRKPYVLRICMYHNVQVNEEHSNAIGEQLRIRYEKYECMVMGSGDVVVERK